jgi:hypothetical protein
LDGQIEILHLSHDNPLFFRLKVYYFPIQNEQGLLASSITLGSVSAYGSHIFEVDIMNIVRPEEMGRSNNLF